MTHFVHTDIHRLIKQHVSRMKPHLVASVILLTGLAGTGCGPRDSLLTIQGTVSLDGKPLPQGQVIFTPEDKSLRAEGAAVKDGGFTIRVHKGPHRVEINAQAEELRDAPAGALPEAGMKISSLIPPEYNDKSTLSFDVQSATDRPAFDLTSRKKRER
jgi:hypothetical protein